MVASISRRPSVGVEHEHRHVGALERAPRLHHAHVVDVLLQQAAAPDAGGVHEQVAACRPSRAGCPRRRAWCPGWARPPRARRRAAGSAATTCPRWAGPRGRGAAAAPPPPATSTRGTPRQRRVEQVAHALAVLGGDRQHVGRSRGARTRRGTSSLALDLVDGHDAPACRLAAAARRWPRRRAAGPARPSTTNTTRSASSMARSRLVRWRGRAAGRRVPSSSPPVSISSKAAPCQEACA